MAVIRGLFPRELSDAAAENLRNITEYLVYMLLVGALIVLFFVVLLVVVVAVRALGKAAMERYQKWRVGRAARSASRRRNAVQLAAACRLGLEPPGYTERAVEGEGGIQLAVLRPVVVQP